MEAILWIVGGFLVLVGVLDIKWKKVPAVLLTAMLFTVTFLYPANLWFGIVGFIFAWLLYELDFFSGIADIKVTTLLAFMIPTTTWMFVLMFLIVFYGVIWKILLKWKWLHNQKECAFLPVFSFVYLTLIGLGGVI
jgi:hypothetical protein